MAQLVKNPPANAGDLSSIPGLGRSPGERNGYSLTPVFWPGEFHGLYSPWGRKESGMTEFTQHKWHSRVFYMFVVLFFFFFTVQ